MKKYKSFAILLAGTLLLGYPASQANAALVDDVILETMPDMSDLGGSVVKIVTDKPTAESKEESKNSRERTASVDTKEVEAGVKSFEKKVVYISYDKKDAPDGHLPSEVTANGDTYVLSETDTPVFVKQEIIIPQTMSYETEVFTGDGTGHEPDEVISDEKGTSYRLESKKLIEQTAKERTEYKESSITYNEVEAGVQIPDRKEFEFEDVDTGQKVKATLDKTGQEVVREYWNGDFVFPITITGYDADVFLLGDLEVPKDADLTDYALEFLKYLKLDEDSYRVSSIDWDGEAYEKDGALVRNAVARGSKYVRDIRAAYAGDVKMPAIVGKVWSCVYTEDIPMEERTLYTMAVNATYQLKDNVVAVEKSLPEKILDKVIGFISAAYEAVITSFNEHPVISSIPLVLLAAFLAFFISRKRKNLCVYDNTVKCPYKKHNKEICKTCVNYHKRNQV